MEEGCLTSDWSQRQARGVVQSVTGGAPAAAQSPVVRRVRGRAMNVSSNKVAILLGAGFSKPWGLPLTAELMRFD